MEKGSANSGLGNYLSVKQFARAYPSFTEGMLRRLLFFRDTNGLGKAGAVIKMGGRNSKSALLIDVKKFEDWLESHREH